MSRTLVVLRHAKSAWPPGVPDHERPLSERGERDAAAAGRWLAEQVGDVDLVVVSSAVRTQQTWRLADGEFDHEGPVVTEPRVYDAGLDDLLAVLRGTPDDVESVLLIGHNPGCEDLVDELAGTADVGAAQRLAMKYPTSGTAVLRFAGPWSALAPGVARLDRFEVPRG